MHAAMLPVRDATGMQWGHAAIVASRIPLNCPDLFINESWRALDKKYCLKRTCSVYARPTESACICDAARAMLTGYAAKGTEMQRHIRKGIMFLAFYMPPGLRIL